MVLPLLFTQLARGIIIAITVIAVRCSLTSLCVGVCQALGAAASAPEHLHAEGEHAENLHDPLLPGRRNVLGSPITSFHIRHNCSPPSLGKGSAAVR